MRVTLLVTFALSAVTGHAGDLFEDQVASVLVARCLECHKGSAPSGGLSFETRDRFVAGGDSGEPFDRENIDDSLLLLRVHDGEMPPPVKGIPQPLPEAERNVLRDWIQAGAPWPEGRELDLYEVTTDVRGGRDWWAFQPVKRPTVPGGKELPQGLNPIDAFIRSRLQQNQMQPAPPAANRTLVRRLFVDVIGLPPSFEELEEWTERLRGSSDRANEISALVNKLLASPHFGERWARFWLDLVRYAESSGYERDQPKAFAWKYRDWVVNAINEDMPCDQFIMQQLAGDEIEDRTEQSVIATGFLRLGTWNDEPNDPEDYKYERLEDMVHATTSSFLGLTVKCARCHDHKFDPIPQDDYYRIAAAFWPGPVSARDSKLLGGPSAEELGVSDVLGWTDITNEPSPLHTLKNGERHQPLEAAAPGPLSFSSELYADFVSPPEGSRTTHRRRQLAEWIVSPENPLTARVLVNRIWLHHFGEGLVRSPNNFGFKGELPTHPELLDWLAAELMDNNWSAKHIHRLILNSQTWQQSSSHPQHDEYNERDSANHMWWHANRRRMDAETLRDSLLSASAEIDLTRIGGEGFKPTFSAEALEGLSRKGSDRQAAPREQQRRRSLYVYVSRSLMPPMMTTFDQCDTTLPCGQRDVTTTPTQALAMLNNHFVHDRSEALATRVEQAAEQTDDHIAAVWRFVLGREPSDNERRLAREHLMIQQQRFEALDRLREEHTTPVQEQFAALPLPVLHLSAEGDIELDDGRVVRWHSLTGRHDAVQSTARCQPTLVTNAINGRPVVRFDGDSRFLNVDGDVLSGDQCTILVVASDQAVRPGLREILSNWHREKNVGTSVFVGLRDANTVRFSDNFNSAGSLQNRGEPFLLTVRNSADGACVWQSETVIAFRSEPLSNRRFGTDWVIGQQGNINGEFWHGDIAELLVFDQPLADDELKSLWRTLMSKYDLSGVPERDAVPDRDTSPEHRSLASLCHVLLNSNEFLYVD